MDNNFPSLTEKKSYNPREVAAIFDVSTATVRRWIKSGELKFYLKERNKRISAEEIENVGRRNRVIPESEIGPRAKNLPLQDAQWLLQSMGGANWSFTGAEYSRMMTPIIYAWIRDGVVQYIGMSRKGLSRAILPGHHVFQFAKFKESDQLLIWSCSTEEEAATREREMILSIKPVYNNIYI